MSLYQNSSFGLMSGSAPSLWSQFMNTVVPSQSGAKRAEVKIKRAEAKRAEVKRAEAKRARVVPGEL